MTRQHVRWVVMAAAIGVGMGAAVFALTAERTAPREIDVVIRDMAFHVTGDDTPNPTIRIVPGESIALTIRNEDPGIVHDFVVPAWTVATKRLRAGESQRIVLTAPDSPGAATYQCSPHSQMMNGTILTGS